MEDVGELFDSKFCIVKKELPGEKHCGSILMMSEASLGE
jgi:hypothetical protein